MLQLNSDHFTPEKKLRSRGCRIVCKRFHELLDVDDANRRNENSAERSNRRDLPDAAGRHYEPERNVLPPAASPEIPEHVYVPPQSLSDAALGHCDQHPGCEKADAALSGVADHQ